MKLHEMNLLVRVAETGSMTRAARQLHVTPAAVSAAIRRLEDDLGVRLFERTTRSVHPTDEGALVIEGCIDVLERWHLTLDAVRGASGELVGSVHLAAPADTTFQLLTPTLARLAESHPQLQVVVHASDALHALQRDAIDIAIRYGTLQDSALTARKLTDQPVVFVAAPTYLAERGAPATPADLREHRCITLRLDGAAVQSWSLHREREGGGRETASVALPDALCGDGLLARRWALDGLGIARKSLLDVVDDLEAGRLVRVLPAYDGGTHPIHTVFPSRRFVTARVRAVDAAFSEVLASRAARCDAWWRAPSSSSS